MAAAATWAVTTGYVVSDQVLPTTANGFYYEATVGGTSGASEPAWPTTAGAIIVDGSVSWTAIATIR